ncbi:hypothetical protein T492DRAFT_902582 [Pavlovales sp. CCMP2436]|nr:hypothetical protein T492DRAFT_902582 [Pavlovales sp. CCMP2436]
MDLVRTIHVPRKFNDLKQVLPPSRYETPLNSDRGGALASRNNSSANVRRAQQVLQYPQQAERPPPKRPSAPELLKPPPGAAGGPPADAAQPPRGSPGSAAGGLALPLPQRARDPADEQAGQKHAEAEAALGRRRQARQAQLNDPNQKLPSVFRLAPPESAGQGGRYEPAQAQQQQQPYGNRRRPEAVRLPYMPSHRDPCQSPGASNQQLRVVRHVAGRTNVSVYHREAPDSARSRLSSHVPEFNPITHQRNYNNNNSNYTPGQYRYIPSPAAAAHGGNNWRG